MTFSYMQLSRSNKEFSLLYAVISRLSEYAAHCDEPISRIIIPESECNSPPISVITDSNIHIS